MKRYIISGLVMLLLGWSPAGAQVYDDIYYTPADAQKEAAQQAKEDGQAKNRMAQQRSSYNEEEQSGGYYRGDEYIDYDNDYYYATNINRFNRPFYNLSFYSGFYNPFWYDPFWVDPYWGWSPWVRPGISISIGGPYWSSFGGWYDWYGYPGFYSAWSYPYYAGGWGMGGGWYGYNAGYYSGYWNGYYAGLYNNYYGHGYRTATYGPRYTLNTAQNSNIRRLGGSDVRGYRSTAISNAERPAIRNTAERNNRGSAVRPGTVENTRVQPNVRNNEIRPSDVRNNNAIQAPDRNMRNNDGSIRNNSIRTAPERPQPGRFEAQPAPGRTVTPQANPRNDRIFQAPSRQPQVQPSAPVRQAPQIRQEPVRTQPAPVRQAPVRTYEAPSRNYSAPAAPSRNYSAPSAPSRSSGGGGGGGYRR